ncbi:MAG TPA: 6-phosphogluconolactonase, partial [Pyrinomonadaceae bacterium]
MIRIFENSRELALGAAEHFVELAQKDFFTVALSGGSTPKVLYQVLAEEFREQVPWSNTHFFWSDERHVPPDHPDSNYRMAHEALLSRVPVPESNVHRVHGENPSAQKAADEYEKIIVPRLDLILLGLGADGHTASIFPGSEVLHETKRLIAAPWVEKLNAYRITMTLPLLNNGASI